MTHDLRKNEKPMRCGTLYIDRTNEKLHEEK